MFAVGDIVVLKSGGVEMTVRQVDNGEVLAEWFGGDSKELRWHWFASGSLRLV